MKDFNHIWSQTERALWLILRQFDIKKIIVSWNYASNMYVFCSIKEETKEIFIGWDYTVIYFTCSFNFTIILEKINLNVKEPIFTFFFKYTEKGEI